MLPEQDDVIRVGIWVLVVAGVVGLLVLILGGRAQAAERDFALQAARVLMDRGPVTAAEHAEHAADVIRNDRWRRWSRFQGAVVDTGMRVWRSASAPRIARGSIEVLRRASDLFGRSPAEDDALRSLELALRLDDADADMIDRHARLRARSDRARARAKLDAARAALADGRSRLARVRLERCVELWPTLFEAERLLAEMPEPTVPSDPILALESREASPRAVALAGALLLDTDPGALASGSRAGALARALVDYLGQAPEAGVWRIRDLADGDDAVAAIAQRWQEVPRFDVARNLEGARRSYRVRSLLGWIGGSSLAERGLELSVPGYRAWKDALTPLNLALSLPSRVYRGFRPDAGRLRSAALDYLELRPGGSHVVEANEWIATLGSGVDDARVWDDGRFVLPRARTPYVSLRPRPLLLTRDAIEATPLPALDLLAPWDELAAVVLDPRHGTHDPHALRGGDALRLLAAVSAGIERGDLSPLEGKRAAALESLRRLSVALHRGAALRVRGAGSHPPDALGFGEALLDGGESTVAGVELRRDGDDVRLSRSLDDSAPDCPHATLCIDRRRMLRADVYARVDVDDEPKVGARTDLGVVRMGLELSTDGPQASLVLPLARWLGFSRWLPLEAHVGVGVEGLGVWPRLATEPFDGSLGDSATW